MERKSTNGDGDDELLFSALQDNERGEMNEKFAEIDISCSETCDSQTNRKNETFDEIPIATKSKNGDDSGVGGAQCGSNEPPGRYIDIQIGKTRKIGEGIASYVVYEVITRTNVRQFNDTFLSVSRRFSDFLGLHSKLSEKYLKVGRIIPPAPDKHIIALTKIKFVEQDAELDDFIEKRKMILVRFLRRIAEHPILSVDSDFVQFLESGDELPKAISTSALSGAGVVRFFNKFGETVNKITTNMDEKDEWFTTKLQQIDTLEAQYQKIYESLETMVEQQVELSQTTSHVAKSIAVLSSVEENATLSKALTMLADVEERVEHVHTRQAKNDFYGLAELFKEYIGLFGAIRDVFNERVKLYRLCEHSQAMLARSEENRLRFETPQSLSAPAQRSERADALDAEVFDWQTKVQRANDNFDRLSNVIKVEVERFESNRIREFQRVFALYLRNHIDNQNEIIGFWEKFLPETKLIV